MTSRANVSERDPYMNIQEKLQPLGRTCIAEVHGRLSPMGGGEEFESSPDEEGAERQCVMN